MKTIEATFRLPTGFIGADIEEQVTFELADDADKDDIESEVSMEFDCWLREQLDNLEGMAEYEIEGM